MKALDIALMPPAAVPVCEQRRYDLLVMMGERVTPMNETTLTPSSGEGDECKYLDEFERLQRKCVEVEQIMALGW